MIDAAELPDFFVAFFSGALVVVCGALYALLFALARVGRRPRLLALAYGAYGGLAVSTVALGHALHLSGPWLLVMAAMLVGYLLAPHGIWHLCVGTHAAAPVPVPDPERRTP